MHFYVDQKYFYTISLIKYLDETDIFEIFTVHIAWRFMFNSTTFPLLHQDSFTRRLGRAWRVPVCLYPAEDLQSVGTHV